MPSRSRASWTMGRIAARCAISMLRGRGADWAEAASGILRLRRVGRGAAMLPEPRTPGLFGLGYNPAPMLWLKAFQVVFVVTWFAGLFYLPRLCVYHVVTIEREGQVGFVVMERRLFFIMSLGALLAVLFGMAMIAAAPGYLALGWMRVKLVLVA